MNDVVFNDFLKRKQYWFFLPSYKHNQGTTFWVKDIKAVFTERENMPPTTVLQKYFNLDLKIRKSVKGHLTSPTHGHCMVEVWAQLDLVERKYVPNRTQALAEN